MDFAARVAKMQQRRKSLELSLRKQVPGPTADHRYQSQRENHMRPSLVGAAAALILFGFGVSSVAARFASQAEQHGSYAGCVCNFGYDPNSCEAAVSCESEGGRCGRSCVIPRE
jgi:hypothetical protein